MKKISIRNLLGFQYTHYKYLPFFPFRDTNQNTIENLERITRNLSFQLSLIANYDFNSGWHIGAGAAFSNL